MDAPAKQFKIVPEMMATIVLVIGLLSLIPVGVYGRSAFFAATPQLVEPTAENPNPISAAFNPHRAEHVAYALAGIIGAAIAVVIAAWTMMGRDLLSTRERELSAMKGLLAFGALYGGTVMLFGFGLFILWFESISLWLDGGDTKEAYKVLIPVAVVVLGAAIMFLGMQPARAEERNNPAIRRLIYGTNLGLSALLLLFALLAVNIVLTQRLPAKLDTTESGFYSLTEGTKKYLATLDQSITIYTNIPDRDRESSDVRRLLDATQEANPARVAVKPLSISRDKDEIERLQTKYTQYNFDSYWVLLVATDDDNRTAFFTIRDLFGVEGADARGRGGKDTFVGESKLMREVLFLGANAVKPVVYFTQGHGELSIGAAAEVGPAGRTANALKAILEKNYVIVKPWVLDLADPKVPDDAAVVIIADPRAPFSPTEATALSKYMIADHPGNRRGKLILLSSPFPNPDGTGVAEIGLEGLLLDYSITLGRNYVLSEPRGQVSYNMQIIAPTMRSLQSGNPIAGFISDRGLPMIDCRRVDVAPPKGEDPTMKPEMLLGTGGGRLTWFDSDPPKDPLSQLEAMAKNPQLQQKFRLTDSSIPVAAIVTEGTTPRLLVVGSGASFADSGPRSRSAPPVGMVAAAVDWLRDRPSLPIVNKTYDNFILPKSADGFRLFYLPVGLVLLAITVAGFGVWTVRRK